MPENPEHASGAMTVGADYTERLKRQELAPWKRWLDVQRPYRWNIRRLNLGRVLDIGCGIGRNLGHLDGNGIGVDHNPASVDEARRRGFTAYTPEELRASEHARVAAFDSFLVSHVAEHVSRDVLLEIIREYLPYLRPAGRIVYVCPQEKAWATDPTHIRFVDFDDLEETSRLLGMTVEKRFSFPFPRPAGRIFPYNEFVVVARLSEAGVPPRRLH